MKTPPAANVGLTPPKHSPVQPETLFRRIQLWAFSSSPAHLHTIGFLRLCTRIVLIMYEEFFRTHIAIRASALTLSIVLSLVPMLALSTSVLKGLGSAEQIRVAVIRFIDQLDPQSVLPKTEKDLSAETSFPSTPQTTPDSARIAAEQQPESLTTHLHHAVDVLFDYVERTNFAALGLIGVLGLIVVVLMVLATIEDAMNAIWHTHKGRPFLRRIMDYLALLILLPISLNVALAADAVLANKKIMIYISAIVPTAWVAAILIKLIPFVFIVITLLFMYLFFPHVKVKTSAAFIGAVFAATSWFLIQKAYIVLQVGVANYNAIYGSFATVPLFLVWLQIGWTFILLGASLGHAIQSHEHYDLQGAQPSPQRQLQAAFDILSLLYDDFTRRQPTRVNQLANRIPASSQADLESAVNLLAKGQLLNFIEDQKEETVIPVTSAENLSASEVVQLILGNEALTTHGGSLATSAIDGASRTLHSFQLFTKTPLDTEGHETSPPCSDHS